MGFWEGSGISCTICKQSAPCSGQVTDRLVKLSMIFIIIIIILFAQYYSSMHICVNTIWKSRTARSDKNTNSCPILLCWQTNTSSLNFLQLDDQCRSTEDSIHYCLLLCGIVTTAWYIAPSKLSVWSLSLKVQQLYLRPVKIVFVVALTDFQHKNDMFSFEYHSGSTKLSYKILLSESYPGILPYSCV